MFVLFGPAGAGKNFVGRIFRDDFHFHCYDADDDLTEELKSAIKNRSKISQKMRDDYFSIVFDRVEELKNIHSNLVIAQTFMIDSNRQTLLQRFPDAKMVFIEAEVEIANERIRKRNDWVDVPYAQVIRDHFQMPQHDYSIVDNNHDDAHVKQQLEKLIYEQANNSRN